MTYREANPKDHKLEVNSSSPGHDGGKISFFYRMLGHTLAAQAHYSIT